MMFVLTRDLDASLMIVFETKERLPEAFSATNNTQTLPHLADLVFPLSRDIQANEIVINFNGTTSPCIHRVSVHPFSPRPCLDRHLYYW